MFKAIINDQEVEIVDIQYSSPLPFVRLSDNRRFYIAYEEPHKEEDADLRGGIETFFENLYFYGEEYSIEEIREDVASALTSEDAEFWTIALYLEGRLEKYTFKLAEGEDAERIDGIYHNELRDISITIYQLAYPYITATTWHKQHLT